MVIIYVNNGEDENFKFPLFTVFIMLSLYRQLGGGIHSTKFTVASSKLMTPSKMFLFFVFCFSPKDFLSNLGKFKKQGGSRTTSLACFHNHILLQSL